MADALEKCKVIPELSIQIGSGMFDKLREKLKYHFLREDSELNSINNPEWIFKYLKDQLETVKLRL